MRENMNAWLLCTQASSIKKRKLRESCRYFRKVCDEDSLLPFIFSAYLIHSKHKSVRVLVCNFFFFLFFFVYEREGVIIGA